jgi:hypothetical protein
MIVGDPVSRYLQHAMSMLPTPFARLVFLTSMRDHYTGHYMHEGWATASSSEEVNAALTQMHRQVFEAVAVLPLLDLCKEIRKHFQSLGESEERAASFWLETEPYYEMIPAGYPPLARKLFISQARLALEVLVRAPGWQSLAESAAWPPQPPDPAHPPRWLN